MGRFFDNRYISELGIVVNKIELFLGGRFSPGWEAGKPGGLEALKLRGFYPSLM